MVLTGRALAAAASLAARAARAARAAQGAGQGAGAEVVAPAEFRRFAKACAEAAGAAPAAADALAEVLVEADLRGHFSHGLNRLDMYVDDLRRGLCDGRAQPRVLRERAGTAWVEGCNALGPVVGRFCMELAVRKAKDAGVALVAARGANHFGIAAWYSNYAMEHGMIGISMTNTSPLLSPTRSKEAALGTNPISVSAPSAGGDSFQLDMATTAVALGKIELMQRVQRPLPEGWAQDASGAVTRDPSAALAAFCLMPLGGAEDTSGYKGYGLALAVEALGGVLADAACGPDVRRWKSDDGRPANLGHTFVAVDLDAFAPGYCDRMAALLGKLRALPATEGGRNVLVPGDPEREHEALVRRIGGLPYHPNQLQAADELAVSLGVAPMKRQPAAES